ncbi:glycosyltransferase [Pannonibacter sp. I15F10I1]|uniref:glycosyltransferase n=1 Tax=Pannonibacter sp. I15F10I1 TaxID=2003580 RepID=UPI001645A93F|nr:glycosyltransferase [Pannonibacter sp. I15F10I1]
MTTLLSVNSYHYLRGGSDAVYFSHAALFEKHGWKNAFFSMQHPDNVSAATEHLFAERVDYGHSNGLIDQLKSAARVIYSYDAKQKLGRLLDSIKVDIAHFHCIYHHLSPSVLVEAKSRRIPTVMTAHDLKIACPAYKMMHSGGVCESCKGGRVWNVVRNRCIKDNLLGSAVIMVESAVHKALNLYDRHLDTIVAPSKFYQAKLIEWGWSPHKIVHIPNFIEMPNDLRLHPPGTSFLYFGRLAPEKGLKTLIAAAALSGARVRIAGTGPEESVLRELARKTMADVTFLGFLSGEALHQEIDASRAIVLPSEWYENGPMSVIEAFARGKPLIGARIGGIPELIVEGETGWSFRSGDKDDLARVLGLVASLPDSDVARMGDATYNFVQNNYTSQNYFKRTLELYENLLSSPK